MQLTSAAISRITTILLDIEGTTTPIDFVYKTLFPFARAHLEEYLLTRAPLEASEDLLLLREEFHQEKSDATLPPWKEGDSPLPYLFWLMDCDRKSRALKALQGRVWKIGYESGQLKGELFPDAAQAIALWAARGFQIAIYSSGSVLAQKLIFKYSTAGDLTPYLAAHFDTEIGPKNEKTSYEAIAKRLNTAPERILFISDAERELDAALNAKFTVALSVRPGNKVVNRREFTATSDFLTLLRP